MACGIINHSGCSHLSPARMVVSEHPLEEYLEAKTQISSENNMMVVVAYKNRVTDNPAC